MYKILIVVMCAACLCFVTLTAAAQKTKNTMTNTDVVEMVKAGLPENTIVLAIQQSEPNFDTSTKALIELKKQGVSQKVLEAMLQPQATTSMASTKPASSTNPLTGQTEMGNSSGVSLTDVTLIAGEKRILMKRSQPNARVGNMVGQIFNPFGKVKSQSALDGNHAQLRVTDTTPEFEMGLPSDVNAADYLVLIRFKPKSDRREVQAGSAGITGVSIGFSKEAVVPTTFEEVRNQTVGGGMKYTIYRVKVVNPLPPGEYAFAPQGLFYDFGIDKGQ
ncbi:MAG: hypothetical protein ACR2N3_18930 [Pyrinomonadaceae bacterium]